MRQSPQINSSSVTTSVIRLANIQLSEKRIRSRSRQVAFVRHSKIVLDMTSSVAEKSRPRRIGPSTGRLFEAPEPVPSRLQSDARHENSHHNLSAAPPWLAGKWTRGSVSPFAFEAHFVADDFDHVPTCEFSSQPMTCRVYSQGRNLHK